MFVRRNKNRSGTVSVQVASKQGGSFHVVKTLGSASDPAEVERLFQEGKQEIKSLKRQLGLFASEQDAVVSAFLPTLTNAQVSVAGPELVLGRLFDLIGFKAEVGEELFRHLVISRLVSPGSKLKTVDYLQRYTGVPFSVDSIYRFVDRLRKDCKARVEHRAFEHAKGILGGKIGVVLYDITTLYFEASDEDELRRTGFSKDGKAQNPQILLGMLVGSGGYPIGYEIFEGNTFEGHTLLKALGGFQKRFALDKPVAVADAGLLSKESVAALRESGYEYILGARLKNENRALQEQLKGLGLEDGQHRELERADKSRLIVHFSGKRAAKDQHDRKRGLQRLEAKVKSGKLTKGHINNRGYNKCLQMDGEVSIKVDYEKYESDAEWDGLKGYVTNSKLPAEEVMAEYKDLWQIEKAFRISKTGLQIRPIYHRLRRRIEAHICICFVSYAIYKELERRLYEAKSPFSTMRAIELAQTMYQLSVVLPGSRQTTQILLKMTPEQQWLADLARKFI